MIIQYDYVMYIYFSDHIYISNTYLRKLLLLKGALIGRKR